MRETSHWHWAVMLIALLAPAACMGAVGPLERAKEVAEAKKTEPVLIRMYNVQDLVLGRDFPYRSAVMPPTALEVSDSWVQASAAGDGGFGDLFSGPAEKGEEPSSLASALSPAVIVDLIKRTIDPESWDDRAKIDRVGPLLVVTQTAENHRRVTDLLEQFRTERPMVAIEARWILLDDAQVAKIMAPPEGAKAGGPKRTVPPVISEAALAQTEAAVIYRGQITCFDRQTVHVASGRAQALMSDVEPVVAEAAVGWDPCIRTLLWGALLEVTPALSPQGQSLTMKVHSMVTEGKDVSTKTVEAVVGDKAGGAKGEVDLPEFLVHTFRTTVRMPLDKPVLIGGMTSPQAMDGKVLYLVIEVSASK